VIRSQAGKCQACVPPPQNTEYAAQRHVHGKRGHTIQPNGDSFNFYTSIQLDA
jgi:hypothetical protein